MVPARSNVSGLTLAFAFGLCVLFLTSCAIGPNYKRPHVNEPQSFRSEPSMATNSFADLPWWQVFHDEMLQKLIRTALTNNYDLRVAVTRVQQARAVTAETRAGLFPQVNYGALAGGGRNATPGSTGGGLPIHTNIEIWQGDINATWELDVWGRVRRMTESARAQYFASEEARRDVTISIIAQVAQDYFQLLALERQLVIARDSTNSFGASLNIFTERLNHGAASKLETSSAQALLESAAATIPDLERQIAQLENQLSVLLGENPHTILHEGSQLDDEFPPEIPAGLPSSLLDRRPDIREAEQQLRSANAQVGVAIGDFLPQLSLTGFFGQVSPELSAITAGGANAWSVGANLAGPIFQGGRLRAQYRQALAVREQNALQYQSAVLNALQEVSSALVAREKLAEARVHQAQAVDAYKQAVEIVMRRYQNGQSSYYEVLLEQQLLFPAENSLVQTELNQLTSVVQLYRALGGGWQTTNAPIRADMNRNGVK